jgi:hypothetical protein
MGQADGQWWFRQRHSPQPTRSAGMGASESSYEDEDDAVEREELEAWADNAEEQTFPLFGLRVLSVQQKSPAAMAELIAVENDSELSKTAPSGLISFFDIVLSINGINCVSLRRFPSSGKRDLAVQEDSTDDLIASMEQASEEGVELEVYNCLVRSVRCESRRCLGTERPPFRGAQL